MTRVTLYPNGQTPVVRDLVPGWNRLGSDIGAWLYPRNDANPSAPRGVQFRCARGGWYSIEVDDAYAPTWRGEGYLPPRAILTVRPDSPVPTMGLLRPYGNDYDWSDGGVRGISPCGEPGSVHDHDGVMQRHAVGLFDMATGKLRDPDKIQRNGYYRLTRGWSKVSQLPEFCFYGGGADPDSRVPADATSIPAAGLALRAQVLSWYPVNGEHLGRAVRFALLLRDDPIVRDDLRAIACDVRVAWDAAREADIMTLPPNWGCGDTGRDFAWSGIILDVVERLDNPVGRWLGNLIGTSPTARMRRIAKHVQHSHSKLLQRLQSSWFYGQPHPWTRLPSGQPAPVVNSGVDPAIDVAQGIEACLQVCALEGLGLKREAASLARTVLAGGPTGKSKWLSTDSGLGVGTNPAHGPDSFHVWPALGAWARIDKASAVAAMKRWPVPRPVDKGGTVGPFAESGALRVALRDAKQPGLTRWAEEALVA